VFFVVIVLFVPIVRRLDPKCPLNRRFFHHYHLLHKTQLQLITKSKMMLSFSFLSDLLMKIETLIIYFHEMSKRSFLLVSAIVLSSCVCICFSVLVILELIFIYSDFDRNSVTSIPCKLIWCRFYVECAKGLSSWSWLFSGASSISCSHVQAEILSPNGENNNTNSIPDDSSYDDLFWSNVSRFSIGRKKNIFALFCQIIFLHVFFYYYYFIRIVVEFQDKIH